ncbi:MAG: hypothetical protein U0X91_04760 [Spirosomataceae bacterium]
MTDDGPPQRFKKFDNAKQLACHAGVVPLKTFVPVYNQSPESVKKAHKGIKATCQIVLCLP